MEAGIDRRDIAGASVTLTLWQFVLVVLAVYRVSRMLAIEDGPFDVFAKVRGKIDPNQQTWVGRGLVCVLCISFWLSGLAALIVSATWIEWLAMAGAIAVYHEVVSR